MGILFLLFLLLLSVVVGIILTLVVQWYLFNLYLEKLPYVGPSKKPLFTSFSLPQSILEETTQGKQSSGAINAFLQFLFQEVRNTKRVRKWFRHRLRLELEELLTRTTTGKLFENIVLRDLDLGSHLPAIRSVEVKTLSVDSSTKLIDEVELCLDLEYSGGFQLSIDASTRLSKMAHVSVKVNELSGQAMLKFTRYPYTHWCFTFYNDPAINLSVESQFQGRLWPQINSLIASQIRKALKRKHTLPFYKIRHKPFFVKPEVETLQEEDGLEPTPGVLELTIVEATRLTETAGPVFCNVAIDDSAWIEMTHSGTASYLTVDIIINKQNAGANLGVNFKQEFIADKYQVGVVVESVSNPFSQDLKTGDIVVMVEGKSVLSLSILNKIIKQAQSRLIFRVERRLKTPTGGGDDKMNQGIEQFGLRNRGGSAGGDKTDSDSSNPPSASDSPAKRSSSGSPDHGGGKGIPRLSLGAEMEIDVTKPQLFSSKDVPFSKVVSFNETLKMTVLGEHKYLNLSVWSRGPDKNCLLGHISLPVATHCCPPTPGHHLALYSLLPPNPSATSSIGGSASSQPGFEPCLCFGDVLLMFSFTPTTNPVGAASSPLPTPAATVVTTPPSPPAHPPLDQAPTEQPPEHNFVRTHFEKVTQCGFCFKKIWLKDALQCQDCLMSCHKKCSVKAQAGAGCARTNLRRPSVQPEIITTPPEEANTQSGSGLSSLLSGLKHAGSSTCLAPPDKSSGTVSLPSSPSHTPSTSRKASVADETLFSLSSPSGGEINAALEALLSRPHDEGLMDAAKASGKMLFAELPADLRRVKIDDMMNKIKEALDSESQNHQSLQKEEQDMENPSTKARLAFLVGKSEERLQALTVLMLHCCAGLQDTRDCSEKQ